MKHKMTLGSRFEICRTISMIFNCDKFIILVIGSFIDNNINIIMLITKYEASW